MPKILLVDDSAVDRQLALRLLQEDEELEVDTASNGKEALARLGQAPMDLVVTDLVMPEMSGLDLVQRLREDHPLLPVVLVTSKGSEDIAVQALELGAASYVPKRCLADDLLDTVHRVLAASTARHRDAALMEGLVTSRSEFEIGNDRALFRPLIRYLQEILARVDLCDESERTRVGVAIEEALNNAAEHGNLEVDSVIREKDLRAYCDLVARRCEESPYRDRRIHVSATVSRDEAAIVIRDEGSGFDWHGLPDTVRAENLDALSGRGVLLMKTFMDEVVYNEAGNEVRMVKRRRHRA
jgi:CheY-like chemotaxis protein/anti-sigma regulatory factor (Ser/Thr protein kinase)